jgi:peptide/nickel transport system permease protein
MRYVIERVGQAFFTVFAVISLSFGLVRLMPGGPMDYLKAQLSQDFSSGRDREQLQALAQTYLNINPDEPVWQQYIEYMTSILQGDLGQSIWFNKPVAAILADSLPWTMFVMSLALLITFGIGIVLGAIMAYNEGSYFDVGGSVLAVFLTSTPYYIFALILLFLFAYQNSIFPSGGRVAARVEPGFNPAFIESVFMHAALPMFSIVLTEFGGWALGMRGNSIRVLGEDYLRVARLRGLPANRIATRYVGRNAILPMYTGLMISIGFVFGGSIILETIFAYPGVGYYLLRAVNARDYPLMMGGFIIITVAVVIGIFVADMTYGKIDPRAGAGENRESY